MIDTYQIQVWNSTDRRWVVCAEHDTEEDARKELNYYLETGEFEPGSEVVLIHKRIDDLVKVNVPREGTWGE